MYDHNDTFWSAQMLNGDGAIVIERDGKRHHYRIRPDDADQPRGFGGARWVVLFSDGKRIETRNLWYQGEIGQNQWAMFPVSAKLCQKVKLKTGEVYDWTSEEIVANHSKIEVFY